MLHGQLYNINTIERWFLPTVPTVSRRDSRQADFRMVNEAYGRQKHR